MKTFKNLNSEEIIEAINQAKTFAQIFKLLECYDNGSNRNKLREFISSNNIDISHLKSRITKENYNPKICKFCGKEIPYEKRENNFCNSSCATSYNNKNKENCLNYCLNCGKEITKRNKYCNSSCQQEHYYKQYIERWKQNLETGIIGNNDISKHIRHYLFIKHNNSCELCEWNIINPYTGLVPLQIHHIDGNCKNNKEENLQLLCPNCHALTDNFGSRNENCTRVDKRYR